MLRFMQLLEWNTIRPYVRYAHHMLQALNLMPRIIFDHEFVWIEQGHGSLAVGATKVDYRKGDLLLIPPGTVHKLTGSFEAHKAIHFDWEYHPSESAALDQPMEDLPAEFVHYKRGSVWLPHAIVFRSVGEEVVVWVDEIVRLYQSDLNYKPLRLQAVFCQMLLRLVHDIETGRTFYTELSEGRSHLRTPSYDEKIEITELANQLVRIVGETDVGPNTLHEAINRISLGDAQIRRLFKRQYGYTPHAYLTLLCMNKARKLLAESETAIQDIAFVCGYEDPKYFSRQFRSLEGISPTAFRSLQLKQRERLP